MSRYPRVVVALFAVVALGVAGYVVSARMVREGGAAERVPAAARVVATAVRRSGGTGLVPAAVPSVVQGAVPAAVQRLALASCVIAAEGAPLTVEQKLERSMESALVVTAATDVYTVRAGRVYGQGTFAGYSEPFAQFEAHFRAQ